MPWDPTMQQRAEIRTLLRDFGKYAASERAPSWVRALAVAGHAPQTPAMMQRATPRTTIDRQAINADAAWIPQAHNAPIAPDNARLFSQRNEWFRTGIGKLKGRVARSERVVVPINANLPYDEQMQRDIAYLIENPNPKRESWRTFAERWVEDILVLGKGGFEYVPNFQGWPVALMDFDAKFMSVDQSWDGSSPRKPHYLWKPPSGRGVGILDREATLVILNPTTYRAEGISYVETLYATIEADAASNDFVRSMLKRYPPPGWLHLGKRANPKVVSAIREKLQFEILGKGGILVTGGLEDPSYTNLWQGNSRDNELMAWSLYFARKIGAVLGLSPQEFGVTMDINRSTATVQQELSQEDGYKAILMLVEEYINRDVVWKFGPPERINLAFRYKELTLKDRLKLAEQLKTLTGGLPVMMMNEARAEGQLPPLELGNAIYVESATGVHALIGEDATAYNRQRAQELGDQAEAVAASEGKPGEGKATAGKAAQNTDDDKNDAKNNKDTKNAAARARVSRGDADLYDRALSEWAQLYKQQRRQFIADARTYTQFWQEATGHSRLYPPAVDNVVRHVATRFPQSVIERFLVGVQLAVFAARGVDAREDREVYGIMKERAQRLARTLATEIGGTLGGSRPPTLLGPGEMGAFLSARLADVPAGPVIAQAIVNAADDLAVWENVA